MAAELQNLQAQAAEFTLSIDTGKTERINFPGTFVRVRSANRSFSLILGSGAPFSLTPGSQYTCPAGTFYPNLVVRNDSSDTLVITLIVGQGNISSDATPQVERATSFLANAATSLAAGGNIDLSGVPTATLVQRRQIVVSNLDASQPLELRDQAGNIGCTIFAQTSVTLPIAGFVRIHNATAVPISLNVSEVWYINQ